MSETYLSLPDSKWDCKVPVVFVPKRRRKVIQTRRQLGAIFHALARQKECQIIEGHLMPDNLSSRVRFCRQRRSRLEPSAAHQAIRFAAWSLTWKAASA